MEAWYSVIIKYEWRVYYILTGHKVWRLKRRKNLKIVVLCDLDKVPVYEQNSFISPHSSVDVLIKSITTMKNKFTSQLSKIKKSCKCNRKFQYAQFSSCEKHLICWKL